MPAMHHCQQDPFFQLCKDMQHHKNIPSHLDTGKNSLPTKINEIDGDNPNNKTAQTPKKTMDQEKNHRE
jgi:hypothetical protein